MCLLSGLLSIGCVRDRDDVSVLLMVVVVHGSMEDRGGVAWEIDMDKYG